MNKAIDGLVCQRLIVGHFTSWDFSPSLVVHSFHLLLLRPRAGKAGIRTQFLAGTRAQFVPHFKADLQVAGKVDRSEGS